MTRSTAGRSGLRGAALVTAVALLATMAASTATANASGFRTSQPSMLTPVAAGATVTPLITVGETLPGGYVFDAIPDGVALKARGQGRVDVWVNHETSTVPFPYVAAAPTINNSLNDFQNATLSHLVLSQKTAGILHASLAIESSANYQRFCSSYLATAAEGFDRELLFMNEEATDFVYRTGTAWPVTPGDPAAEQAGLVVAVDIKTGKHRPIYGMGRHNHENSVAIPGFNELMVMSGDDTFTSNPAQSQVYAYFADSADEVWNDRGSLWGFRANDPALYNDYYDFPVGSNLSIEGEFVEIPRAAAIGDQSALENASDALDVFQFIRIEDIAYDKTTPNVVYLADTGRGSAATSGNPFASTNGRIWKMVLDPADPRHVLSLSVLIDGDQYGLGNPGVMHQPDNLETTAHGLFITEDASTANRFPVGTGTTARVWWYHLDGPKAGTMEVAFAVDQSADEGPTDVDPSPTPALWGDWEASGIVDASAVYGPGAFLVTVQAHSLFVEVADGPDLVPPAGPDWLTKREGGQLLLVRVPGA